MRETGRDFRGCTIKKRLLDNQAFSFFLFSPFLNVQIEPRVFAHAGEVFYIRLHLQP